MLLRRCREALGDADSQRVETSAVDPQVDDQAFEALSALLAEDRIQSSAAWTA